MPAILLSAFLAFLTAMTLSHAKTDDSLPPAPNFPEGLSDEAHPLFQAPFRQAWRPQPEPGFLPAEARLYADSDSLLVTAVLRDADIGNRATGFNELTWQTGDVFEIFIQTDPDTYFEFHITPENRNLFLAWTTERFAQRRAREVSLEEAMIDDPGFIETRTRIHPEKQAWTVFARIPLAAIGLDRGGEEVKVAFARYDAGGGLAKPVLSATPDFPQAAFHNREVWHPIRWLMPTGSTKSQSRNSMPKNPKDKTTS